MTDIITGKKNSELDFIADAKDAEIYGVKSGESGRIVVGSAGGLAEHDRLVAVELAQAAGQKGYATKAALDADLAPNDGTLALVTNDGTAANNGTYRKSGATGAGSWIKSADRVSALEVSVGQLGDADAALAADLAQTESTLSASITEHAPRQLSENTSHPRIAFGIADEQGRVAFGATTRGMLLTPGGEEGAISEANSEDLAYGIVDNEGNLAFGVTRAGGLVHGGGRVDPLSGANSEDLAYGIVDSNGRLAFGVRLDGSLVGEFSVAQVASLGTAYEQGGDIFLVRGGDLQQLTATGDNSNPRATESKVRFLSTRRRGVAAEYEVAVGGQAARAYADVARYEQIIVTGQSLAQGGANAAITTTAPFPLNAFKFTNGPIGSDAEDIVSTLAPLAEAVNETICTGFAKKLLTDALDRTVLLCGQAWGGQDYDAIKKGGTTTVYADCIQQVAFGPTLDGKAAVRAVFLIHGEADGIESNTGYADDLAQLLADYTADIKAANGQVEPVVLLLCQTSSAAGYTNDAARDGFVTPFLQLQASETSARIFMVGPKYHLTYVDHSHIDALSERLHGEYYAKVYRKVVIGGEDWHPVSPSNVAVVGSDVVIDFHVPVAPLVFDTTAIVDPGNYGFVLKNAGTVAITGVTLTGPAQVTVSLSDVPPAASVLSYAFHNGTYTKSGPTEGARGCLRDSDPDVSAYTGLPLRNWCVAFKHTF